MASFAKLKTSFVLAHRNQNHIPTVLLNYVSPFQTSRIVYGFLANVYLYNKVLVFVGRNLCCKDALYIRDMYKIFRKKEKSISFCATVESID